jgi:type VI secretion system ImpA family protein
MMGRPLDPLLTDLDRLSTPISVEHPCGEWLRYEGTYEQIRDARREDDAGLPQGVWQTELKRANWGAVEQLCAEALTGRSKDLQLAAWLLEAWIQLDSFAGAARGIELMRRLSSAYWDQMYPALDADMTPRLAPIQWVNDKLSRRLRLLPLTQPAMEGISAYSLAEWDIALRNPSGATDSVNMAKFQQSVTLTDYRWFVALNKDVLETIERVRAFDELIDEKVGSLAPGLIKFRTEALSVAQLLETMLSATRGDHPKPEAISKAGSLAQITEREDALLSGASSTALDLATPRVPAESRIRTRAEAYDLLEEIASFLYRNDPHSPTSYLIWRAVGWRDLHFNELLPELVRDNVELSDLVKLLRLDAPPNSGPR